MFVFAYPHSDASVVGEKTSKFSVKDFLDGFLPSADAAARSLEASGGAPKRYSCSRERRYRLLGTCFASLDNCLHVCSHREVGW